MNLLQYLRLLTHAGESVRTRRNQYFAIGLLGVLACSTSSAQGLMPALPPPKPKTGQDGASEKPKDKDKPVQEEHRTAESIVVAGQPLKGFLKPPATDSGFEFELEGTAERITIKWKDLDASQRTRIRRQFGMPEEEAAQGERKWGKVVKIVRLNLKSGRSVEGVELPHRAKAGYRCLQSSTMVIQVAKGDIKSEEVTEKRESEIYKAEQVYDRMLLENPPRDNSASDHMAFVPKLMEMGLYDRALEHLRMANTIDPRTASRTEKMKAEILANMDSQMAQKLHQAILKDSNRQDFVAALEKLDRFARNYPKHELLASLEARRPEWERNRERDFKKDVVKRYYALANDLIKKKLGQRVKVDEKGQLVPPIPGKQISTVDGKVYRGPLVEEKEDVIVISQNNEQVEISRKEIRHVRDVDLSTSHKSINPTFALLRAYASGALGKEIVTKIALDLKAEESKVAEAWESRFQKRTVIEDGRRKVSPSYAVVHEADYDAGTWLRGSVGAKSGPPKNRTRNSQNNRNRKNTGNKRYRSGSSGSQTTGMNLPRDQRAEAMVSTDPEVWWSVQNSERRLKILRAIAAEAFFHVKKVEDRRCPTCAGRGALESFGATGKRVLNRCPTCRGRKSLVNIIYD